VEEAYRFGIDSKSFNPCFPGSSAESIENRLLKILRAVSILVFLDQALKEAIARACNMDDVFQSLFSWIKR